MSGNSAFHEIFLHFNWHCTRNMKLITGDLEPQLHRLIQDRCIKMEGVFFHGAEGTNDHVHLIVQVAPTIAPCELIGEIKGYSAHEINKKARSKKIVWQRGYGVVSFAKRNLKAVQNYVRDQKKHHAGGTVRAALERWSEDAPESEWPPEAKAVLRTG